MHVRGQACKILMILKLISKSMAKLRVTASARSRGVTLSWIELG